MRKICFILILTIVVAIPVVFVSHAGTPIVPIPFSADYTITDESGELIENGRYYIGAEGVRMEIESDGESIVTITNLHKGLHFGRKNGTASCHTGTATIRSLGKGIAGNESGCAGGAGQGARRRSESVTA